MTAPVFLATIDEAIAAATPTSRYAN